MLCEMLTDVAVSDFTLLPAVSNLRMALNGGLQIAVLLTPGTTDFGNRFQLFARQVRTPFDQPCFSQIFTYLRITAIERNRTLIIANPFIRVPQFAGGIATVVPGFADIGI